MKAIAGGGVGFTGGLVHRPGLGQAGGMLAEAGVGVVALSLAPDYESGAGGGECARDQRQPRDGAAGVDRARALGAADRQRANGGVAHAVGVEPVQLAAVAAVARVAHRLAVEGEPAAGPHALALDRLELERRLGGEVGLPVGVERVEADPGGLGELAVDPERQGRAAIGRRHPPPVQLCLDRAEPAVEAQVDHAVRSRQVGRNQCRQPLAQRGDDRGA